MNTIQQIAINAGIDFETIDTYEQVEGGTINGGIQITQDGNLVLQIVNLGTEAEDSHDLDIEGYQSWRFYRDEESSQHAEDFDDTEDGALATIKAFLA